MASTTVAGPSVVAERRSAQLNTSTGGGSLTRARLLALVGLALVCAASLVVRLLAHDVVITSD